MVFESLIRADNAEEHPFRVFLLGGLFALLGIIFDLWFFDGRISNLFIFVTVFAGIPLMYKIIVLEEGKEKKYAKEKSLLQEHKKALIAFVSLFLGIFVMFTFMYVVLPAGTAAHLFASQIQEQASVQQNISGNVVHPGSFSTIFTQNLKVLLFSFLFSFFFGAGAIFILTWNAATIAVALGSFLRDSLPSASGGSSALLTSVGTVSYGFFGYMTHGIFEVASYFLIGLAGGIISVAVIRHEIFTKNFNRIIVDSLWLAGLSLLLLVVGGIVETSLSPLVFH